MIDYIIKLKNVSKEIIITLLQEFVENVNRVSEIMMTSKGRDKIFSLAQYTIELYVKCMKDSQIYGQDVKKGLIDSVKKAKIVRENVSSGRKVFKFLKFIDEYRNL